MNCSIRSEQITKPGLAELDMNGCKNLSIVGCHHSLLSYNIYPDASNEFVCNISYRPTLAEYKSEGYVMINMMNGELHRNEKMTVTYKKEKKILEDIHLHDLIYSDAPINIYLGQEIHYMRSRIFFKAQFSDNTPLYITIKIKPSTPYRSFRFEILSLRILSRSDKSCGSDQFHCSSKICLDEKVKCDGIRQCYNSDDEDSNCSHATVLHISIYIGVIFLCMFMGFGVFLFSTNRCNTCTRMMSKPASFIDDANNSHNSNAAIMAQGQHVRNQLTVTGTGTYNTWQMLKGLFSGYERHIPRERSLHPTGHDESRHITVRLPPEHEKTMTTNKRRTIKNLPREGQAPFTIIPIDEADIQRTSPFGKITETNTNNNSEETNTNNNIEEIHINIEETNENNDDIQESTKSFDVNTNPSSISSEFI
ncbi:hypothetical protein SNEBB_005269 [Seison nebaliae]|nr:hypothetical protein SNEBB_005269 [Seison nebaliae]